MPSRLDAEPSSVFEIDKGTRVRLQSLVKSPNERKETEPKALDNVVVKIVMQSLPEFKYD
jgi:hypothetical protein